MGINEEMKGNLDMQDGGSMVEWVFKSFIKKDREWVFRERSVRYLAS